MSNVHGEVISFGYKHTGIFPICTRVISSNFASDFATNFEVMLRFYGNSQEKEKKNNKTRYKTNKQQITYLNENVLLLNQFNFLPLMKII